MKRGNSAVSFKELGSSPAKQKGFTRTPDDFDHGKARTDAKKRVADQKARDNFNARQSSKTKAKKFVKNLKIKDTPKQLAKGAEKGVIDKVTGKTITNFPKDKSLKKFAKKALKVGGKSLGVASLGVMAYDAYKSGQKHSGGKTVKGQKTGIVTPDKSKSIYSKPKKSIYKK